MSTQIRIVEQFAQKLLELGGPRAASHYDVFTPILLVLIEAHAGVVISGAWLHAAPSEAPDSIDKLLAVGVPLVEWLVAVVRRPVTSPIEAQWQDDALAQWYYLFELIASADERIKVCVFVALF